MQRTQIYLPPAHLKALRRQAKESNKSVTELVRQIVADHVEGRRGIGAFTKQDVLAFVALGRSKKNRVSEHHDEALDEAFRAGHLR